jgi:hypothetical protein
VLSVGQSKERITRALEKDWAGTHRLIVNAAC